MAVNYTAAVRKLTTKVQRYSISGGTSYGWLDTPVISWEVQRVAEDTKFFGQVVVHRLNLKMRPAATDYSTDDRWRIRIYDANNSSNYTTPFGYFYTTEVHTDENTGIKSITAYDRIKRYEEYTIADLNLTPPYTIQEFANAISQKTSSTNAVFTNIDSALLALSYSEGANLDGSESLFDCLRWIAEVLNAICYVNGSNELVFRRLDKDTANAYTQITREDYITCKSGDSKRLGKIIYATELGDNVEAHTTAAGSTQVVQNNAFLDNRTDRATLVQNAITNIGGLTIGTFEMSWRGNPALTIGDRLQIALKDGTNLTTYLLDETITFDGSLSSKMRFYWDQNKETDEFANPSTIGDVINQTYARVDKVNKEINLVINDVQELSETVSGYDEEIGQLSQEVSSYSSSISQLQQTTSGLSQSVSTLETHDTTNTAAIGSLQTYIDQLAVGGRNLLLDTNAPSLTKVAANAPRYFSSSNATTPVPSMVAINDAPINIQNGAQFAVSATSSTTGRYLTWYSGDTVPMEDGETYTMSCYAKLTSGAKAALVFQYGYSTYKSKVVEITNTEWKMYSHTFTYSKTTAGVTTTSGPRIYMGIRADYIGTTLLCGFKLEKGTLATDYVPAPEDVDYNIVVAQNTADTATENISSVSERVSTLETTTSGISATVSSHTTSISTLTTATGTLQTEFNNLEIGGRNLLLGTKNSYTTDGSVSSSIYTQYWYVSDFGQTLINTTDSYTITFDYEVTGNSATNAHIYWQYAGAIGNATTLNVGSNSTGTYSKTLTLTQAQAESANQRGRIRMQNATDGATLKVWNLKLEQGTKSTSYTEAPEDTDAIVGGRNIALGTSAPMVFTPSSGNNWCSPLNVFNTTTYGLQLMADLHNNFFTISFDWAATGATVAANAKISLKYTSSSYQNVGVIIPITVGSSSGHIEQTFQPTLAQRQYGTGWMVGDQNTSNTGIEITISNFKFEVGNRATTWTVAPEETASDISTLSNDISNTQTSLGEVSNNVNTLTTDLDGVKDDLTTTTTTLTTQMNELSQAVNLRMTETDVTIAIEEALNNGVTQVQTETGYKFDKDGLNISRSDSDLSTLVDNTGMTVSNQFEDVLKATAAGVETVNLVARNYIDIGTRSRIMDYGTSATGIFWIGD